jgi:hypothetical protein
MMVRRAGQGALHVLGRDGEGRVMSWGAKASYLRLPAGLVALTSPGVSPGPLHAECDDPPPRAAPGSRASVQGGLVRVGAAVVDATSARLWTGALPPAGSLRAGAKVVAAECREVARASGLPEAARARRAEAAARAGDVVAVADAIGGLGPGLTPAGDDVLAGLLLWQRALLGPVAEARLLAAAASSRTNGIAAAFLHWAARGQSLAPAHDLLLAAARGDRAGARRAARVLAGVGHTSGADLCLGLAWGSDAAALAAMGAGG